MKHGIKSGYKVFLMGLKTLMLEELERKSQEFFDEVVDLYWLALSSPATYLSFIKHLPKHYAFILEIDYGDQELPMLEQKHSEMVENIVARIKGAESIESLKSVVPCYYGVADELLSSLEQKINLIYQCPNKIQYDFNNIIEEFTNKNFTKLMDATWKFDFCNMNFDNWIIFIDKQSTFINNWSKIFPFFWTVYRNFRINWFQILQAQLRQLEFKNEVMPTEVESAFRFLELKCSIYRPKLCVYFTERHLIEFISSKWLTFSVRSEDSCIVHIDDVENFVKTNFSCIDSKHDLAQYPYKISVPVASDLILFLRNLYELNFFSTILKSEICIGISYKKVEIQLWVEYVFRDVAGFSSYNIETYFVRKEIRERDFRLYNRIKSQFQKSSFYLERENVTVKSHD